jgi:DNA mismatch repair protein MutS2
VSKKERPFYSFRRIEGEDLVDDALMVGVSTVTILHGKGTGALKEEIRRYLRTVPNVSKIADDHADRGGAGITIVTFVQD